VEYAFAVSFNYEKCHFSVWIIGDEGTTRRSWIAPAQCCARYRNAIEAMSFVDVDISARKWEISVIGSLDAATPELFVIGRAISETIRTKRAFSFYLYLGERTLSPRHGIPKEVGGVKTNWIHGWSRARGSSGQLTES